MLYGCVEGCGLGCAGCLGAAYPSHYDPYTGEKIEGLGILPPPAYVTAPPGAFTYYKPQPVIGKGVSFLPKVGVNTTILESGDRIDAPVDAAEKQLAVMPVNGAAGKGLLVAGALVAAFFMFRKKM